MKFSLRSFLALVTVVIVMLVPIICHLTVDQTERDLWQEYENICESQKSELKGIRMYEGKDARKYQAAVENYLVATARSREQVNAIGNYYHVELKEYETYSTPGVLKRLVKEELSTRPDNAMNHNLSKHY